MLVIYPMLISNAVSENIIPGIVKTVEGFIVVESKNMIIDNSNVKRRYKIKLKSGRLTMRENTSVLEDDDIYGSKKDWDNWKNTTQGRKKEEDTKRREIERKEKEKEERENKRAIEKEKRERDFEREKLEKKAEIEAKKTEKATIEKEKERIIKKKDDDEEKERVRKAKSTVKISDNRAVSIEPSTAEIDVIDRNGNTLHKFLGIKVMPLRIRSDTKLSRLILHDVQISNINALVIGTGRTILKRIYNISRFWSSNRTLSGDPRRDIIMGRSGFGGEGFIVLSKTEDIDETFMSNISKLNRLFKLGWGNIIIVDDIKRQVHFCMKSFKGVCTTLSFSTIYQNLGHLGVYENLEDAKKKTSMVFKTKSNFKKLFAEYKTQYKISKYLNERIKNNE